MQKLLFIVFMMGSYALVAQKTEFSIQLQSGLFSFGGKDASKTSWINKNPVHIYSSTNWEYDDYGKKPGFSYSIEAAVKKLTQDRWLFGVGLAFESLQSKMDIDEVVTPGSKQSASGSTTLEKQFVNINPFLGKRVIVNKLIVDIAAGPYLAFCIHSHEKANVTTVANGNFAPEIYRPRAVIDIRSRFQLTAWYKKFGLLLGYSFGMTNYYRQDVQKKAFSRFLRAGISYRLK